MNSISEMAAIIAQLAAANRKRKQRQKHILPPEKSNLALPPFDPCFDPKKHNRYLRLKALVEHRQFVLTKARGTVHPKYAKERIISFRIIVNLGKMIRR